ncbi:MAG: zinc ribbon domain-containing protein [Deltaproteobacteria bacterium]|nr:zinc ribbon domain-containing protein [Deltaproteobacteria bacterium]
MPLFDYLCADCGIVSEILITGSNDVPRCKECGSTNLKRLLSTHSTLSGSARNSFPGPGDTACCGSSPSEAGCAGPGSCCGKVPS